MNEPFARGPSGHTPHPKASDELWADALATSCTDCHASAGVKCRNTITGKVMPVPHYHRIQAAEKTV